MHHFLRSSAIFSTIILATACTITKEVKPVKTTEISRVCIQHNPSVHMKGFEPTLQRLIETRGIRTNRFTGDAPADCQFILRYTANWYWDLAMYLTYTRIDIFEDGRVIGTAVYDARRGSARLSKFGSTESKLDPLVSKLLPAR